MGVIIIVILILITVFGAISACKKKTIIKLSKPNNSFSYFSPQKAVEWFDFYSLYKSFIKIADTGKTLAVIDKREVISSFNNDNVDIIKMGSDENEKWLDFFADTGDGFNSTTTLFYHLTRSQLQWKEEQLQRGSVCIVGGDLVYPDASEDEYNNRFKGPLRLVFNHDSNSLNDRKWPNLIATPGNHDWYDGCTAFLRMMCQQKPIGGYKTIQNRTYFGYKITDNLHLLGIDNQLMGDIDIPQLNYFKNYFIQLEATSIQNVLMIVAEPYWYNYKHNDRMKYRQRMDSLEYLIVELKRVCKFIKIKIVISGDIHHYAAYTESMPKINEENPVLITSGGGGAFKHLTHKLEPEIHLPVFNNNSIHYSGISASYKLKTKRDGISHNVYPDETISKKNLKKNLCFAFNNWLFSLTLGFVLWITLVISGWDPFPERFSQYISGCLILPALYFGLLAAVESKECSDKLRNKFKVWIAFFSTVLSVTNLLILHFLFPLKNNSIDDLIPMFSVGLICILIGFLNNTLFGIFLLLRFEIQGKNLTEASSSKVEESYNHFLRMKITKNEIKIYVVGIDKVIPFDKIVKELKPNDNGAFSCDKDLKTLLQTIDEAKNINKYDYKIIDTITINY